MAKLQVELVSPEREIWAGEADMVVATTLEGDLGILPGHTPVLGSIVDGGVVRVVGAEGGDVAAAVRGGFLSVAGDRVSVLAEWAELGTEVDVAAAQSALEHALSRDDEAAAADARLARARLRAAGREI